MGWRAVVGGRAVLASVTVVVSIIAAGCGRQSFSSTASQVASNTSTARHSVTSRTAAAASSTTMTSESSSSPSGNEAGSSDASSTAPASTSASGRSARATGTSVSQPYILTSVAMTSPSRGYALAPGSSEHGSTTEVLDTTDGGAKWHVLKSFPLALGQLVAPSSSDVYIVGSPCKPECSTGTTVMRTTNGGNTWHTIYTNPTAISGGISFTSTTEGWLFLTQTTSRSGKLVGLLLHTPNGGKTWTPLSAPCESSLGGLLSFVNQKDGWGFCIEQGAAGLSAKTLLRTTDAGRVWKAVATTSGNPRVRVNPDSGLPSMGYVSSLFFVTPEDGWLCGQRMGCLRTADGGVQWVPAASYGLAGGWLSVGMFASGFGWLVDSHTPLNSSLLTTANGGKTWTVVYPPQIARSGS